MRMISLLVIHCTASRINCPLTPAALEAEHRQRGFSCCGYHYYIRREGTLHAMRPVERAGAHVRGHNANSIGIAYEGGLLPDGTASDTRTLEQKHTLLTLLTNLMKRFPDAIIVGHRDLSPDLNGNDVIEPREWIKLCPCFNARTEYAELCTHKPL